MDVITSNPALLANAEKFRPYVGRRVRTVVKVNRFEGGNLHCQAPDGPHIVVRQVPRNEEFTQFVEVIGVVEGDTALRAEICTNFGDRFDLEQFSKLCDMANGSYRDIFMLRRRGQDFLASNK
ncbi:hypothetical protein R1flu_027514 [Riccia fluitans]|uniref:Replication factor A protein 3 n=1 Tax=Riccia fluitans TaxID=41844 RepID=A0ABD1XLX0_9MARC